MTPKNLCNKPPLSPSWAYDVPVGVAAYEYFGFHTAGTNDGWFFRVFAPHADAVSVCGDFNGWDPARHPMKKISAAGVWELFGTAKLPENCNYKYFLRRGERGFFKSDPFGTRVENHANGASVAEPPWGYTWRDGGWMRYRKERSSENAVSEDPLRIYRVDPLWWRRQSDGRAYGFRELAGDLIPYVKQMGFTHVALLGVIGGCLRAVANTPDALYAPAPVFGEPRELMRLIDSLHEAGIGVILSQNPFFFAASEHGLSDFDGERLFEAEGENGAARAFDLKAPHVRDFLLANALFWAKSYHADGLSVPLAQSTEEIGFLKALRELTALECPDVRIVTESDADVSFTLMGSEFGDPWREGDQRPLNWALLDQHMHAERQLFTARENHAGLLAAHGGEAIQHTVIYQD